ncbi:hypothetical protein GWO43_09890 [candidate division KSB1 bacterium]|nr:hypothetical protein [candidate division KSB1 bacterium]NIR69509.1 hypothetical protein [candidate division KSB1 bacterium]NIS24277.1 hypothetical protein [candidate division KSB1 bacterium]NIT71192.1 hypothetical protein [candidate division KSB1 bacterium]NIU24896.1 hypothetical protein [candidate division KSB1 bacterium]
MNANEVKLVRVYTREKGGIIFEDTFPFDAEFEVVLEARAGTALFATGGRFEIQAVVRDLTDNRVIVHKGTLGPGNFGDKNWPAPSLLTGCLIPAQGPQKEGHIYEVIATLAFGTANPNISFVRSPVFIICKP